MWRLSPSRHNATKSLQRVAMPRASYLAPIGCKILSIPIKNPDPTPIRAIIGKGTLRAGAVAPSR
jgi:hypothetical protein